MQNINRREFFSQLCGSFVALPFLKPTKLFAANALANKGCWLTACVPLVIEDAANKIHTDIILTSNSFDGIEGFRDEASSTDYEISLYDSAGKPLPIDGSKELLRLNVAAMHTTLIPCGELVRGRETFWGGLKIRMFVKGKQAIFVSDLFSSAYVRWNYANGFDTLHAHPDPLQLQVADKFYSSMPFPSLEEYGCKLAIFNPYSAASTGKVALYATDGSKQSEFTYSLAPCGSTMLNLDAETPTAHLKTISAKASTSRKAISKGGSIIIENDERSVKNFAYLMIKGKADNAFAAEHTIHQGNYEVKRGYSPFGANNSFNARGWLFTSFIFKKVTMGGLQLSSRVYLSSGRPLEDELWLLAYATDAEGNLQWTTSKDKELGLWLPQNFLQRGAIKLNPFQSCQLDFENLSLPAGFVGGIGIATSPPTSHVLMKVEVKVANWNTSAFSHFRPGLKSARAMKSISGRGGLATDYLVTGAHLKQASGALQADALLAIFNLEEDRAGNPTLEVFGKDGLITRKALGHLPESACKHMLLSKLFPELLQRGAGPLTLRLVDDNAVITLAALHIDYQRQDIAIDHGSDRFSTHIDFGCQ
jgi:hypothetical protein